MFIIMILYDYENGRKLKLSNPDLRLCTVPDLRGWKSWVMRALEPH